MSDYDSKLAEVTADIAKSKDKAKEILTSYGLIICDSGKKGFLNVNEYMYGHPHCFPDKVEFVFISADIFLKFLLNVTTFTYIFPLWLTLRSKTALILR
jgi:hypothetical protein